VRDEVVALDGVEKRFGTQTAVDGLDLTIQRGGCFGLLGPNGAGKTTSLRMIYGAIRPTAGQVRVFGLDVKTNARAVRKRLGVTLQENVLIQEISARENFEVFGRYHLLDGRQRGARAEELLEFLELGSHANRPVRELSGGFRRRVAIGMSLMNRPELLILDEPSTGLDPAVRQGLWERIRQLRSEGTTVLITTHYMDEAERLSDDIAILSGGKLVSRGAPKALIEQHLAPRAIEVDCTEAEQATLCSQVGESEKILRVGRRLTVYLADAVDLAERLQRISGLERRKPVVRPTNLEDVFLSLTGTHLVEATP
jgi:lipooligosaccharide transport system ATP-binding protein